MIDIFKSSGFLIGNMNDKIEPSLLEELVSESYPLLHLNTMHKLGILKLAMNNHSQDFTI